MEVLAAHRGRIGGLSRPVAAALLAGLTAAVAHAQDMPLSGSATTAAARSRPASRLELSASSMPSFDGGGDAARTTRLDMVWLPPRRPSLGLALGLTSNDAAGFGSFGTTAAPAVDLGLHWRYDDVYRIDVTAWRRMTTPDPLALNQDRQSNYGARLEMQMNKSSARSFRVDHGFLGMQLESGARIGLRRSGGHPMLYYRTSF
jgi:hypothetical protein